MTEFTNDFSYEVWRTKFSFNEDNVNQSIKRVANDLASIENNPEYWAEQFEFLMSDFKFVPAGRIISNAGTGLTGTTYINCFVDGFTGKDQDSIEGIYAALTRQAKTLQSEGGYGFCCDVMRPRGAVIRGIGNQSPGAVKFLELWDKSSEIITSGSGMKSGKNEKISIRKGAQMVTMSVWHPDIFDFIEAKKTEGRLTKFNMSVLSNDKFMEAVEKDQDWVLFYPDYEKHSELYKEHWNGDVDKWFSLTCPNNDFNEGFKIYKTVKARELWDFVMVNTYNRNEPGILQGSTINRMNNLYYCEHITATNPCGEQILPIGGVCLLGSINLTQFINTEVNDWNWELLSKSIPIAVRMLDNVNDITRVPLPSQKENLQSKRRIGLGVLGYASALLMMNVRYGSEKALEMTRELCYFIKNEAYSASSEIAREKGVFPLYNEKYLESEFIRQLDISTQNLIKNNGIRSSHLLSIQPTGNTSVYANNVSGGLEPLFGHEYIRTSIVNSHPEFLDIPKHVNWKDKTYESKDSWEWIKEGDENMLRIVVNNTTWKYDRSRGLLKETLIEDYGVRALKKLGKWIPDAEWAATAFELNPDDHINTMKIFAANVDSAISKTINLPNNFPYEDFKNIYIDSWKAGIKGFTTYREGTMASVLARKKSDDGIVKNNAPKRPKKIECDIHHITVKSVNYFVAIGLIKNDPYEVFVGRNNNSEGEPLISKKDKKGFIAKVKSGSYELYDSDNSFLLSILSAQCDEHEESIARLTSVALRHGADIQFVVESLNKTRGDLSGFSKSIARALKTYITDGAKSKEKCPDCNVELVYAESCKLCKSCGYSKCG